MGSFGYSVALVKSFFEINITVGNVAQAASKPAENPDETDPARGRHDILETIETLDKADPIKRTLSTLQEKWKGEFAVELILNDGTSYTLNEIIELGVGAAQLIVTQHYTKIEWKKSPHNHNRGQKISEGTPWKKVSMPTLRYSAINAIHQVQHDDEVKP